MKIHPAIQETRPARRRPARIPPAATPVLLNLLLALLTALLGRPARTRRTSWHYAATPAQAEGTRAVAGPIPRPLRRGSPDIIIAQAHAGPRRYTRARPAPPHAPATTARAPPRALHVRKRPQAGGRLRSAYLLRYRI